MFFNKSSLFPVEAVKERWSYLIAGAEGKGEEIFQGVKESLEKVEPPKVKIAEKEVHDYALLGFKFEKRNLLIAENDYLVAYKIFVSIKDYGKQLMVSWYLIRKMDLKVILEMIWNWLKTPPAVINIVLLVLAYWSRYSFLGTAAFIIFGLALGFQLVSIFKKIALPGTMTIYDLEELTAYVTTVHHSVLESVAGIMRKLNQDPSKINRESKGFLNIS
jgi:hypothetical protein